MPDIPALLKQRSVVVLLSGGMDSSTLLYYVASHYEPSRLIALSIDYGQRHARELLAAKAVSERLSRSRIVLWHTLDLALPWLHTPLMADSPDTIPAQSENRQSDTVVPGRNAFLLSAAVSYALTLGASAVYFAAVEDDYLAYADCRQHFVDRFSDAMIGAYGVSVEAPFLFRKKAEVVTLGLALGVPYHLTYTCYRGAEEPCMECDACAERISAFEAHGLDYYGFAQRKESA